MSWKLRWGWDRHETNIQPTAHKETRKEKEERGCGCGWGGGGRSGSIKIPLLFTVSWWKDGGGVSLSLMSLSSPSRLGEQLYNLLLS